MVVNLQAARTARPAREIGTRMPGTLLTLVADMPQAALETMAAALGQLPSGACLTMRDTGGREWYVGSAARANAASFGEAV
jgi:hypothetical protein